MKLVLTPCLVDDYTARPNVSLQITTNKYHQRLSGYNVIRCATLMFNPYILCFRLHIMLAYSDAGHQLLKNSEFSLCHHNPYSIHPLLICHFRHGNGRLPLQIVTKAIAQTVTLPLYYCFFRVRLGSQYKSYPRLHH